MSYDSTILADSPLAYWKLDDAASPAVDSVSAYNLTLNGSPTLGATGPITSDGAGNRAMTFVAASSQYAQAASATTFVLGNAFSFECWVKPTTLATTSARQSIIANTGASHTPALEIGGNTTTPGCLCETTPGFFICQVANTNPLTTGSWFHVVYTRTAATAGSQLIYVNGVSQPLGVDTAETYVDASVTWAIARRTNATQLFNGSIARVAVYGSALSSTRVSAHLAAATAAATPASSLALLGVGT